MRISMALALVLLCSCAGPQANEQAATGLRAADALAHASGFAQMFPAADAELHRQIALREEEARKPPEDQGGVPWFEMLGSVVGAGALAFLGKKLHDAPGRTERDGTARPPEGAGSA